MLTGDQLRMARALLRLTVEEAASIAGINKGTIVRIETGAGAHKFTLEKLREGLEARGAVFTEPQEGVHGPGVALTWGAEIPRRSQGEGTAASEDDTGGMKAAWDDFDETADADLDALLSEEPGLNPDMAEMWRDDPELWARLSQGGRETLSRSMFGDLRAVDGGYFGASR
jgi:DNA-binding XRE family transcriptional regulator